MAAASDVHQLQHHSCGVRVQLDKVDCFLSQAKAVDAHQVLRLTQTFGPHLHLPHFFESRARIWHSIVACSAVVSGVLTFALQLHHGLVPLVLVRLVLRGDGETLGPGVEHDHVLVLGVGPLVDVEAGLQGHGFLRDGGLAAEFLLALVVLQAGRAALRRCAEHEVAPVHGLLFAEVAALPHVLAALRLARLALHDARCLLQLPL